MKGSGMSSCSYDQKIYGSMQPAAAWKINPHHQRHYKMSCALPALYIET